ncbi:phosphatase PAP2 family protein [Streptomyces sp. NBC_00083]|uniref:phosphatase PAP2 family protein n=1 Tax=Streptomyces sp. NBC_00083 TaxID=2975647 RepID=UPI0022596206|nr:phosphatase PAP2 family protein [Streptomyces sp. NBC_00083]MCX5384391.1 phosphatase PAP2 family protein [Streptomyces sp. NBC_00083]
MSRTLDSSVTSAAGHRRGAAPVPPGPGALRLGAVLLLVTVVLGACVDTDPRHPFFQGLDDRWLSWMGGPHGGVYGAVAAVLNWFGGPLGVVVPLALLIYLVVRRRWASVGYLLVTYITASFVVVQALKYLVDRPRPAHPLVRVDHGSFPSGHATGAAMLVVMVGALLVPPARRRTWWVVATLFTATMMWSRTWLHAHWLSDTVAGAAAGAGTALMLWWVFRHRLAREG